MGKTQDTFNLSVVQSISGRDRNMMYLVLDCDYSPGRERLVLSNGRGRGTGRVKEKNPAHVKFVSSLSEDEKELLERDLSDLNIRAVLSGYDKYFEEKE